MDICILREVFQIGPVLDGFLAGNRHLPEVQKDLIPQLFLAARSRDPAKPDYVYHNPLKLAKEKWQTWTDVVQNTLNELGDHFFEMRGRSIHVRYAYFAEWQHLLPEISPLALVSACLLKSCGPPPRQEGLPAISRFVHKSICPQIRHSALPTVFDARIERLIENNGLDDLHVHINGTSEMESVWLEALCKPTIFASIFREGERKPEVREFLRQVSPDLTHEKILVRLRIARRIQRVLAKIVIGELWGERLPDDIANFPLWKLVSANTFNVELALPIVEWPYKDHIHPVQALLGSLNNAPMLAMETLLLMATLDAIQRQAHPALDKLLYIYLSLMVHFGELIVQTRYLVGFDQFQKITFNEIREELERRNFKTRLYQLQYSANGDLDTLECRISPKQTPSKNLEFLKKIENAYDEYIEETSPGSPVKETGKAWQGEQWTDEQWTDEQWEEPEELSHITPGMRPTQEAFKRFRQEERLSILHRRLQVNVVAHFIKQQDNRKIVACRHYMLRQQIARQRRALQVAIEMMKRKEWSIALVGFDAASNELHAPPEVFAPVFRALRHEDYIHFTFHVGEDFVHLTSGIRAIMEAAEFLDMRPGNRLGHCTAIGVNPVLWRERIGNLTTITQGEWLDNLVFARAIFLATGNTHLCTQLSDLIARLSYEVYGKSLAPELLQRAWKLRSLDPLVALDLAGKREDTLDEGSRKEFDAIERAQKQDQEAFEVFERYHHTKTVECASRMITVIRPNEDSAHREREGSWREGSWREGSWREGSWREGSWSDPFTCDAFAILQKYVIEQLEARRLVLETLPTSNVRIHVYNDYREHHLFRWLGFGTLPVKLPIVVGSDDPGIFATCMRNEYAHILRELDRLCDGTSPRPETIVEELIRNGKTWRFRRKGG